MQSNECKYEHTMEFDRADNGMQVFVCAKCGKEMIEYEDATP